MINYMGRYIPDLATVGGPLFDLLKGTVAWTWDQPQESAFQKLKETLITAPVLAYYDSGKPTAVSADASSYGLGGVLLQQHGDSWKPVAYCSRRLNEAETRYAQIEKECLAGVWACERFEKYLIGLDRFRLITDHKPLVPLINKKDLDTVPIRCQRLLMRLMRFAVTAEYAPGKTLVVADALSRSPIGDDATSSRPTADAITCYVDAVIASLPVSQSKLSQITEATEKDEQLQLVSKFIKQRWPEHIRKVPEGIRDYFSVKDALSIREGLIILGRRICIPKELRQDILERIHEGHLGLTKCRERAASSVWWPGISSDINNKIDLCMFCRENRKTQRKEPLKSTPLPERPWQRVAIDICENKGQMYLIVSDYYSRFIEILHLPKITTAQVINRLQATFARFGIPEQIMSDNGPQFTSEAWTLFKEKYDFEHVTSSPHNPQANGHAERAVQVAKRILRQDDPHLALMCYRATPHSSTGVSPAELLMGRKIRTTLPILKKNLQPKWPNRLLVRERDALSKRQQAFYFNRRHGVRDLPELQPGDAVLMKLDGEKSWKGPVQVRTQESAPRSFVVEAPKGEGEMRRNRRHLQKVPAECLNADNDCETTAKSPLNVEKLYISNAEKPVLQTPCETQGVTVTRSGRVIKPTVKLNL